MADGNHEAGAVALQEGVAMLLSGPTLSTVPLAARLPSQARQEAEDAGCPVVLFATLRHVRRQGGGGLLGRVAGEALGVAAGQAPVAGVGGAAARVGATAAGSALMDLATTVKIKDEMSLDYRLEGADGATLVSETLERKAESDGEDLLSPLLEHAALAVAAALDR